MLAAIHSDDFRVQADLRMNGNGIMQRDRLSLKKSDTARKFREMLKRRRADSNDQHENDDKTDTAAFPEVLLVQDLTLPYSLNRLLWYVADNVPIR